MITTFFVELYYQQTAYVQYNASKVPLNKLNYYEILKA